jgi:pyruvate/2-oxoglutarate dehydrogenase complex dihydrolipoamide dehydrogenase (E3) component
MRSDIVPGAFFPDYELPDHTTKRRRLSELRGQHPMVLVLSRGGYCPKDRRQHELVIFTEPEVATVGLTEQQARTRGITVRVVDYDIGRVAGAALYADDYAGQARMVIDAVRNVMVGVTLVGPSVGELIHAATIAVPIDRLWHAVPAYPTISEVWLRLLETLGL